MEFVLQAKQPSRSWSCGPGVSKSSGPTATHHWQATQTAIQTVDETQTSTRYHFWSHVFRPALSSLRASHGQCGTAVKKQHYPAVTRMPFTHDWVDSKLIREDNLPDRETSPLERRWRNHRQEAVCQHVHSRWELGGRNRLQGFSDKLDLYNSSMKWVEQAKHSSQQQSPAAT